MTKIEELNKELDELQVKIEEVQKKIEEAKQAEWPQRGDKYWYMFGTGEIFNDRWSGVQSDVDRQTIGNAFRTEKEAEFELERLKVTAELKKFAMTREEVKAARYNDSICYLYLNTDNILDITSECGVRTPGVLYFESSAKAWEAVDAVGTERIKNYYFGVYD